MDATLDTWDPPASPPVAPDARRAAYWGPRWLALNFDLVCFFSLLAGAVRLAGSPPPPSEPVGMGLVLVAWILYRVAFEASPWAATPGKRLLRIRLVTAGGARPSLVRVLLRVAVQIGLGLTPAGFLGGVVLFLDRQQRGPWDFVAGTRVVMDR